MIESLLPNDLYPNYSPLLLSAVYDHSDINETKRVYAGGFVVAPFVLLETFSDGISEQTEGSVLFLEIIESELDPRDVGNVSLSRSAYLVRINDSGNFLKISTTPLYMHHNFKPTCMHTYTVFYICHPD